MPADTAAIDDACTADAPPQGAKAPTKRRRRRSQAAKTRLLSLEALDARTAVYRQITDEVAAVVGDLGGAELLSTAERAIISDACLAGAMVQDIAARWLLGEQVEVADLATLANVRRRNLAEVGIRRQPRPMGEVDLAGIVVRLDRDDAGLL